MSAGVSVRESSAPDAGPGAATKVPWPYLRVRRIPDLLPPVIDPRAEALSQVSPFIQGTLGISFGRDPHPPTLPGDLGGFGPQRAVSDDLPEPEAWVRHMARALVEVMSGARPAPQVIRWTTHEVYSVLARRNAVASRRTHRARPAIVLRVRICQPADGVVEACAVVVDDGRVRALAMRLTGVDRRWVITDLQVG